MRKAVIQIVKESLSREGFDGLFNPNADCACLVAELAPCGEMNAEECVAGWRFPCNCGEHDFHIAYLIGNKGTSDQGAGKGKP